MSKSAFNPGAAAALRKVHEQLAEIPIPDAPILCPSCGQELRAWHGARSQRWLAMHRPAAECPLRLCTWRGGQTRADLAGLVATGTPTQATDTTRDIVTQYVAQLLTLIARKSAQERHHTPRSNAA